MLLLLLLLLLIVGWLLLPLLLSLTHALQLLKQLLWSLNSGGARWWCRRLLHLRGRRLHGFLIIRGIVGVVEHGLFLNMASLALVAGEDGVTERFASATWDLPLPEQRKA